MLKQKEEAKLHSVFESPGLAPVLKGQQLVKVSVKMG